jgi:cbb3-type cytochrome oxidase maturation protein
LGQFSVSSQVSAVVLGGASLGDVSLIYTLGIGILLGVFILGFFIWGLNTGAFDHSEDAKYVLFRDDDDDDD